MRPTSRSARALRREGDCRYRVSGRLRFANRRDAYHAWALELLPKLTPPLLTCEAVLAETAFHLRNTQLAVEMCQTGLVTLAFDLDANLDRVQELATRYADQRPDLADLCLICLTRTIRNARWRRLMRMISESIGATAAN